VGDGAGITKGAEGHVKCAGVSDGNLDTRIVNQNILLTMGKMWSAPLLIVQLRYGFPDFENLEKIHQVTGRTKV
jgi:hypothetical protein